VANQYAGPAGRIVEFSSENGGGLISLLAVDDILLVDVYNCDANVQVRRHVKPSSVPVTFPPAVNPLARMEE